jgi:hypothetical protein
MFLGFSHYVVFMLSPFLAPSGGRRGRLRALVHPDPVMVGG